MQARLQEAVASNDQRLQVRQVANEFDRKLDRPVGVHLQIGELREQDGQLVHLLFGQILDLGDEQVLQVWHLLEELVEQIVGRVSVLEVEGHLLQALQDQVVVEQHAADDGRFLGDLDLCERRGGRSDESTCSPHKFTRFLSSAFSITYP